MINDKKPFFMQRAIDLSRESLLRGGGPFGAVIVAEGEIVAEGANGVALDCDPTAHAEVSAIRRAARKLDRFDLSGCEIYTSCEPCPMCLGAIYWARLDRIYYAADRQDAARAGFDDSFIYDQIALPPESRSIPTERLPDPAAREVFAQWLEKEDKTRY
jgi:tRNA(Arg) A34 adenosine deaminase TadA